MVRSQLRHGALAAIVLATSFAAPLGASATEHQTTYLTINGPFSVPGVDLPAGTYIFELANPVIDVSIVRVMSRDRSTVYFMGFTNLVRRPAGLGDRLVSFGERRAGAPLPIAVWYPSGDSRGREFVYR